MNPCDMERWETISELAMEGSEVGWSYHGHPTETAEREALEEMLDRFGRDADAWLFPPEVVIRHAEVEAVERRLQGEVEVVERRLQVDQGCRWFVYGILDEEPAVGAIVPGMDLPAYGQRPWDSVS
jgi:hypothetical protein